MRLETEKAQPSRDELSKAENHEADYSGDEKEEEAYSPTSPADDDDGGWREAAAPSVVAAPPSSLVLPGGGQKSEPLPTSAAVPSQSVAVPSPPGIAEDDGSASNTSEPHPIKKKANVLWKKMPNKRTQHLLQQLRSKMNKRRSREHLRLWLDALKKNKRKVTRAAQPGQRRNGVKNKAKKRKMRELKPATESNRAVGAPPPPPAEEGSYWMARKTTS